MKLLYLLEKIRLPGVNELMLLVTRLGEETAFLVLALIVFWCIDKRRGYFIMAVGFMGTMVNQILKLVCAAVNIPIDKCSACGSATPRSFPHWKSTKKITPVRR